MKTKLFILFLLALGLQPISSFGQSESETLDWLNAKKDAAMKYVSYGDPSASTVWYNDPDKTLEITSYHLRLASSNGAHTTIKWDSIKDVRFEVDHNHKKYIKVISNELYKGNNVYIKFFADDDPLKEKYVKALKHFATLKGAKLVKDDLF